MSVLSFAATAQIKRMTTNTPPADQLSPSVSLYQRPNADNSLSIMASVKGAGVFSVIVHYGQVANTTVSSRTIYVDRSGEIERLEPIDHSVPVEAYYSYTWVQGKMDVVVDADFLYRLPYEKGTRAAVKQLSSVEAEEYNIRNAIDFRMAQFSLWQGAPVYAVRKGVVAQVLNMDSPRAFDAADQQIVVQHDDGSIAQYSMLGSGSALVAEGDTVWPDTQIASAGTTDGQNYMARLAIYCFKTNTDRSGMTSTKSVKVFLDPIFAYSSLSGHLRDAHSYKARVTKEMINRER